jgi:cysteine synthase
MTPEERDTDVVIALADPRGAGLYHYDEEGQLRAEGDSITEVIGQIGIARNRCQKAGGCYDHSIS